VFLALIVDTHLPRGDRRLTDSCLDVLRAVDLIVHAGDFSESSVLADLRTLGPVSAAVNSFSAKEVGHMAPSSRFALSLKPNVAYLDLNFCALW
jgi:hypothetical protein